MNFEEKIKTDLHEYLKTQGEVDERLAESDDINEKWQSIAQAYLTDGIREFTGYPTVSLGWVMYIGMAVARYWEDDWKVYGQMNCIYSFMRGKRGYDELDEYVLEEVLMLKGDERARTEKLVGECASRTYSNLRRERFEPGTPEAFRAYVSCIHQLYLFGAGVQLQRMGYKFVRL